MEEVELQNYQNPDTSSSSSASPRLKLFGFNVSSSSNYPEDDNYNHNYNSYYDEDHRHQHQINAVAESLESSCFPSSTSGPPDGGGNGRKYECQYCCSAPPFGVSHGAVFGGGGGRGGGGFLYGGGAGGELGLSGGSHHSPDGPTSLSRFSRGEGGPSVDDSLGLDLHLSLAPAGP
ncbi:unnamed protein product [Linum tenue]|uniref:Uncharacterized protein n=1 Tax=Linum tenue TaxID=586396 RepID=A0AAV0R7C0_9ROSI|nr:unnamed protein product [Linum tenue]